MAGLGLSEQWQKLKEIMSLAKVASSPRLEENKILISKILFAGGSSLLFLFTHFVGLFLARKYLCFTWQTGSFYDISDESTQCTFSVAFCSVFVLYHQHRQDGSRWQPVMDLDTSIYLRINETTDLFLLDYFTYTIIPPCIATFAWCWLPFQSGRLLLVWENCGESHVRVMRFACSHLSWALLTKTVICSQVLVSVDLSFSQDLHFGFAECPQSLLFLVKIVYMQKHNISSASWLVAVSCLSINATVQYVS